MNPNLRPWKKGQSGNPGGKVGLPPEVASERRRNQAALIRLVIAYFGFTEEQAQQRLAGPDTTQLEAAVQGMINRAKEGDTNCFKYLTELICGKIPDQDDDPSDVANMSDEQSLEVMKRAALMLEQKIQKQNGSGT